MTKVTITVNGRAESREVEDRTLLVHFLRDQLEPDRDACRLRHVAMRRLRRPHGRGRGEVLHGARGRRERLAGH